MTLKQIIHAWDTFFFKAQSPLPFALFRILYGFLVLQCLLVQLLPDFEFWYGANGILNFDSVARAFWQQPVFDLLAFGNAGQPTLVVFFITAVLAAVGVTIGFATRFSAAILFLCFVSMHYHNPMNINSGDVFLRLCALFIAMSYAGESLSVDRWLKERQAKRAGITLPAPSYWPWAQRLFQIQVVLVYWQTSVCKLAGQQWIDGSAIWYATRLEDLMRIPIPFLFDTQLSCQILTWGTLAIEVALWSLIWVKELRYWVLLAGLLLHLGIDAAMSLPLFEWAFIAAYITFIEPADLQKVFERCRVLCSMKSPARQTLQPAVSPAADAPEAG